MQDIVTTKDQPPAPPAGFTYASFSARAFAFSVDQAILLLIIIVFTIPAFILFGIAAMYAWPFFVLFIPTFCSIRIPAGWFYFAMQESSRHQATFGKRLAGLRVTDMEGNRLTVLRATVRYFAKFLSAAIMLLGFFMAAFTEKHQALHDLIADTLVLKKVK